MEKRIKIKLEKSDHLKTYMDELDRWEGEGGSISDLHEILEDLNLPVKTGDIFEVTDGNVVFEDNDYFYEAVLKKQPESSGID